MLKYILLVVILLIIILGVGGALTSFLSHPAAPAPGVKVP
jgi:flagellar basal body-associated protein FliL